MCQSQFIGLMNGSKFHKEHSWEKLGDMYTETLCYFYNKDSLWVYNNFKVNLSFFLKDSLWVYYNFKVNLSFFFFLKAAGPGIKLWIWVLVSTAIYSTILLTKVPLGLYSSISFFPYSRKQTFKIIWWKLFLND